MLVLSALTALLVFSQLAQAADERRSDTNTDYLSETWRGGLGSGIGAYNAIEAADIDADGEDELVFGNSDGYLHILDWNESQGTFIEKFQSVDLGGAVRGLEIVQLDDDAALEIIIGHTWADSGKVKILDGATLKSEINWTSGLSWSHTQSTERDTYGLAAGDLDGDGVMELAVGGSQGYLWVVDADTPETDVGRDVEPEEAEWYVDLTELFGSNNENVWGLTMGNLDADENMEVAVGTKQGWVGVFDGASGELQWKLDIQDDSHHQDGWCYGLLAVDLDGNGIDELVVAQQKRLTIFKDGEQDSPVNKGDLQMGYGLEVVDLFGNSTPELVVADKSGTIYILGFSGGEITTYQSWDSGYSMSGGSGVTVSMSRGADTNPWIIHGGNLGVLTAWEVVNETLHQLAWSSLPGFDNTTSLHSLPGGFAYGTTVGNIDDDPALEILVGTGSGRVYAFDGENWTVDWVSPMIGDGTIIPMGLAVADLDADGTPEIVIGTGNPGEQRDAAGGEGAKGHLYIFADNGSGYTQIFESNNLNRILGLVVLEMDGTPYPEIGLITSYTMVFSGMDPPPPEPHGRLRVWGFDGAEYRQENSSGDLEVEIQGLAGGDADDDGLNELAIGTQDGQVLVYGFEDGSFKREGDIIDTGRRDAYGVSIADIDDDSHHEILVGTSRLDDEKALLLVYDGETHNKEWELAIEAISIWGIGGADIDGDNETELIYGTSGGELFIRSVINGVFEAKTSALSGAVGFYGGLNFADLTGNGSLDLVVGSDSYLWVLLAEGVQPDRPDLYILSEEIKISPTNPDEDEDISVNVTLYNMGGFEARKWRVSLYDGVPGSGGNIVYEYTSKEHEVIHPGDDFNLTLRWDHELTSSGDHTITVTVHHIRLGDEAGENRKNNNAGNSSIYIEEVPDEVPVAMGELGASPYWINNPIPFDAGGSYDNETTGNRADNEDGLPNLTYSYYPDDRGTWTDWMSNYTYSFSFGIPGVKTVELRVRDDRGQVSPTASFVLTVSANTPPVPVLTAEATEIYTNESLLLNISGSSDPEGLAILEYRFNFGYGVESDWVREGSETHVYQDVVFDENGTLIGGSILRDEYDQPRNFTIDEGLLVSNVEEGLGYYYSLPEGELVRMFQVAVLVREYSTGIPGAEPLTGGWSEYLFIAVRRPPNVPPVAIAKAGVAGGVNLTDTVLEVEVGVLVNLTAEDSYDPDGVIVSYSWTIDGRVQVEGDQMAFDRGFNEPGLYRATVKVTDDNGVTSSASVEIQVNRVTQPGTPETDDDSEGTPSISMTTIICMIAVAGWFRRHC